MQTFLPKRRKTSRKYKILNMKTRQRNRLLIFSHVIQLKMLKTICGIIGIYLVFDPGFWHRIFKTLGIP